MKGSWFKGKKITVFGVGLLGGGVGTIRYLASQGAHVIATDIKTADELERSLTQLKELKNVTYILGRHRREDFSTTDMVIKTPSCPWTNEHVQIALKNNIPVETDASLFMQLCKQKVIGITGSKGKTTTSHYIHHLLTSLGVKAIQVGIGTTSVLDRLQLLKKDTVVVFELSSWRLSAFDQSEVSPDIAVFTNLFPDHLNYYKSMEEYFADKKKIFQFQKATDTLVYTADNEYIGEVQNDIPGQEVVVGRGRITDGQSVFIDDGMIYINDGIDAKKLMAVADLPLRGTHNQINALLSIGVVCALMEVAPKQLVKAVTSFHAVAHRMEHVRTLDGVEYINDTAATAPEAAIASITSYTRPVVVLAGGADKKLPIKKLAQTLANVKHVLFFKGASTDKIISAMIKENPSLTRADFSIFDAMTDAVAHAHAHAASGDVVLLSPGAASFGVFKNEFDRGNQFKECVASL